MKKSLIIILSLFLTCPVLVQAQTTDQPSSMTPDIDTATLSAQIAKTPPEALQKAVTMWGNSSHSIFVKRRACFEALVAAQKSGSINEALITCEPAAKSGGLTPRRFIASILAAMN